MTDLTYNNLRKGDSVIFARVLPNTGDYKIINLNIVTVNDEYCTGVDSKTKQTFLFEKRDAEEVLFLNRNLALEYLNNKKKENRDIKVAEY